MMRTAIKGSLLPKPIVAAPVLFMTWNETNYPPEMAHLAPEIRGRAAKLASTLVAEGYPEQEAVRTAIRRMAAEQDVDVPARTGAEELVVPHERGWAVTSPDGRRRMRTYPTRDEALAAARELARREHGRVNVESGTGEAGSSRGRGKDAQ